MGRKEPGGNGSVLTELPSAQEWGQPLRATIAFMFTPAPGPHLPEETGPQAETGQPFAGNPSRHSNPPFWRSVRRISLGKRVQNVHI